jgi:hypothetical protein
MDRKKANELLNLYEEKPFIINGKSIKFARQDIKDVKDIEAKKTKDLTSEWKGLVWLNEIYGQISLNDMERISLIELELDKRLTEKERDKLHIWYEKTEAKNENTENNI